MKTLIFRTENAISTDDCCNSTSNLMSARISEKETIERGINRISFSKEACLLPPRPQGGALLDLLMSQLHHILLKTPKPIPESCEDDRWKPFKGCLGVLDGSAHDGHVLRDAISRSTGLKVPQGCYYLVDAGYCNSSGFLAPYRGHKILFNSAICLMYRLTWMAITKRQNDVEYGRGKNKRFWIEEESWIHKDAKGLYNVSFPYFTNLDIVYGKDRATGDLAEDPLTTENAETEYKEFNDEIRGFMNSLDGHLSTMSTWMQGTTSRMPQVLELLEKHWFSGPDKYKASKAICQDSLNVDLLFSLDSTELYILLKGVQKIKSESNTGSPLLRDLPGGRRREESQGNHGSVVDVRSSPTVAGGAPGDGILRMETERDLRRLDPFRRLLSHPRPPRPRNPPPPPAVAHPPPPPLLRTQPLRPPPLCYHGRLMLPLRRRPLPLPPLALLLPPSATVRSGPLFFWAHVFYLSKLYELADTLLILLSERRRLTFLHVYHHAIVIVMCYVWLASAQSLMPAALVTNASVHVVMYAYYLSSSAGWRWTPRWKRAVTELQIAQFVFSFPVSGVFLWYHFTGGGCEGMRGWLFNAAFNASLLALFVDFHLKAYKEAKKKLKAATAAAASPSTSSYF
ncbi:hypothetical protein ZIOFF_017010 [Zingiber officinale]|uniref:very-long-chain 3-oxoacyl-CoA synthase n=1 Tax=Zingiber officinale TaxID=94328 RepID=A0A8J5HQS0_ZINOF|nr:hypothetical protein ZIOFF_017010 [Zingiber officinale]